MWCLFNKAVILENLSTALDIRLTSNIRTTSKVEVYYRITSSEEARNIDDLSWIPFNTSGNEDITVTSKLKIIIHLKNTNIQHQV